MNIVKDLLDWVIKAAPKHCLGIGIVCLVVVGLPESWREYLGYEDAIKPYRAWVSLAGLASGVYGLVLLIAGSKPWIVRKWEEWRLMRNAPSVLGRLSPEEKGCLSRYIEGNSTCYFSISNGVVGGLVAKVILWRSSNLAVRGDVFAFNLQPWVFKSFERWPDLKKDILNHTDRGPGGTKW